MKKAQLRKIFLTAFAAVSGIGRKTLLALLQLEKKRGIFLPEVWKGSAASWKEIGLEERQIEYLKKFRQKFTPEEYSEYLAGRNITVIMDSDPEYPDLLSNISDKPVLLFVRGKTSTWNTLPIAVVGTRHPTGYGTIATQKIIKELSVYNATIISGFMYGIDILSHKAAVEHQLNSVGVLGFGFDHTYPAAQWRFFDEFLAAGNTLVSEFAPSVGPKQGNFVMRNRIVAGMAHATVVVEAAARSGSLITAQLALEYGRTVCAVPGPITSKYSEGTKNLLKDGATVISSGQDILSEIQDGFLPGANNTDSVARTKVTLEDSLALTPIQKKVWQHLSSYHFSVDELSELVNISSSELTSVLSMLEIHGLAQQNGGVWQANSC